MIKLGESYNNSPYYLFIQEKLSILSILSINLITYITKTQNVLKRTLRPNYKKGIISHVYEATCLSYFRSK